MARSLFAVLVSFVLISGCGGGSAKDPATGDDAKKDDAAGQKRLCWGHGSEA
jgi:hypothetical protein